MILSNKEAILSKTISFLRFPLIVAVVFIHSGLQTVVINGTFLVRAGQYPRYDVLYHVVTNEVARVAVPLFFFFSGFLFFFHSCFSMRQYGEKLKKRARTLLLPYVFWNVVVFLLLFIKQRFLSSTVPEAKLINDYEWLDWLNLFWNYQDGMPICYQFWFLRDLMVVALFTPFLYWAIRHCRIWTVVTLGMLWLLDWWFDIPGFGIESFFFFTLGAWFGVNGRDFTVDFRAMHWPATFLYFALIVLGTWMWSHETAGYPYVHRMGIVVGVIAVVSWTAQGVENGHLRTSAFLEGSSFLVYAYHGMIVGTVVKCWAKVLPPVNEWIVMAGYLSTPFIVATVGVGIYALLHKCCPSFLALITGGR